MIVNDFITQAWKRSGLIDQADTATGDEISSGLNILNFLISSLNAENWWPVSKTETEFIYSGQDTYTIGNGQVDVGTITAVGPNLYIASIPDSSLYTTGTFIPVRLKQTPQVTNEADLNWQCDVLSTDTGEIVFGLNDYDLEVGDEIYLKATGQLPDIVSFRPISIDAIKYSTGSSLYTVNQYTLATWNQRTISEAGTGYPYKFRYLPNVPYGLIDFGQTTTAGINGKVIYDYSVDEVSLSDDLSTMIPPEYISALVYMLAAELLVDNGGSNQGVFSIAANRKKQIEMNNMDVAEINTRGGYYYDYRSGRNNFYGH